MDCAFPGVGSEFGSEADNCCRREDMNDSGESWKERLCWMRETIVAL